ncbi:MAG: thymidylate synthase [Kiritimatiellia bacterium]
MQEILHVVLHLQNPQQRWVFSREPAINPAFAIAEVVWILSGRNDSAFLNYFLSSLPKFAGNDDTYHGAYGHRLRAAFGMDQLNRAFHTLAAVPSSRQVVLQFWNPPSDMPSHAGIPAAPDIPCNVCALLKIRDGQLHWTQIIRSNDVFRGLPYNLVQFTTLHEVMAGWLKVGLGPYVHYADSLHLYESDIDAVRKSAKCDACANRDELSASYEDTITFVRELEALIEAIISPAIDADALDERVNDLNIPSAWRNMAVVLVSEGCRKRGRDDLARSSINTCSNPVFLQLASRWCKRLAAASK